MVNLQPQPNKLMFDEETLKLATNFYNNNHDKKIVPLQDLENDFSENSFLKLLVKAKYYGLGEEGTVPEQPRFQLGFFKTVKNLKAERKSEIMTFFVDQFEIDDKANITKIVNHSGDIGLISIRFYHDQESSIRQINPDDHYSIVAACLFEFTNEGAFVHYIATTKMKTSEVAERLLKNKREKWFKGASRDCLENNDKKEEERKYFRSKGLGRFLLHFVQAMCCCINAKNVKLYLQSSDESLPFYLKCKFVNITKFPRNVSDVNSSIPGLPYCLCESVISLNSLKGFNHNFKSYSLAEYRLFAKKTLAQKHNLCYMNAMFQFLSYSYQDIKPPRELNDEILKEENYGNLKYPDLEERIPSNRIKQKEIGNIMKRVPHFQEHFNGFFMKTFNDIKSLKKSERQLAMTNMVLDMKIIPLFPYSHNNFFSLWISKRT